MSNLSNTPQGWVLLKRKFGFSEDEINKIKPFLESRFDYANNLAKMSLYIKGLGFLRHETIEVISYLGLDSTDLANWEGISSARDALDGDIVRSVYAYRAGLNYKHLSSMAEEELTLPKLKSMAMLRTL